jgi:Co/Zn/Cd efflux system component
MACCRLTREDTEWLWVDAACTFVLCMCVICSTKIVLFDTLKDLMEAAPRSINVAQLAKQLHAIQGVQGVRDLHVWGVGGGKVLMTSHIDLEPSADHMHVQEAVDCAAADMGITHSTIQLCD